MFDKESEEYINKNKIEISKILDSIGIDFVLSNLGQKLKTIFKRIWQEGAKYGYNKANEWHYVKNELPRKSDSTLCELMPVFVAVRVGYKVETYGTYWNLKIGKFECLDEVYAWCYTPEPPELPKEIE